MNKRDETGTKEIQKKLVFTKEQHYEVDGK